MWSLRINAKLNNKIQMLKLFVCEAIAEASLFMHSLRPGVLAAERRDCRFRAVFLWLRSALGLFHVSDILLLTLVNTMAPPAAHPVFAGQQ